MTVAESIERFVLLIVSLFITTHSTSATGTEAQHTQQTTTTTDESRILEIIETRSDQIQLRQRDNAAATTTGSANHRVLTALLTGLRVICMTYLSPIVFFCYRLVISQPLLYFYMHAPCKIGWCGKPAFDICAALTSVPATHWIDNADACINLIATDFQAYDTIAFTIFYIYLVGSILPICIKWIWTRLHGLVRWTVTVIITHITKIIHKSIAMI